MVRIEYDGDEFIARVSFNDRNVPREAGFHWDKTANRYVSQNAIPAFRLVDYADDNARAAIFDKLSLTIDKEKFDVKFPAHRGLSPFAHQVEGVNHVLTRRTSYLAFAPGAGKTPILPLCMNTRPGRAIVVCPTFLKFNWEIEIERWFMGLCLIQRIDGQRDKIDPKADVYILPDSLLHVHELRDQFFINDIKVEYLFIDEAHRYKTPDAKRTLSLIGGKVKVGNRNVLWAPLTRLANKVVALSGTPIPNRPIEIHPLVKRIAPHAVNYLDRHNFALEFCNAVETEWGWDYNGASNEDKLNKLLTRDFMLIKDIDDCVDLPAKLPPQFLFLEDTRTNKIKKGEMQILEHYKVEDLIQLESLRDPDFAESVQEKRDDGNHGPFSFISELRKLLGRRKLPQSISIIKDLLNDRDKIVVFCWHEEIAEGLVEGLSEFSPLKITGKVSNPQRHKAVESFQNDKAHRVLVANIQAAGVGVTLTASSDVVFVESSWVPVDNDQAIARCRRIGQTKSVQARFLVVKDSLDHLILNAHLNKNKVIEKVMKQNPLNK